MHNKIMHFNIFKEKKTVELGMLKKDWNKLLMSNAVHFYIPNSLWYGIHVRFLQGVQKDDSINVFETTHMFNKNTNKSTNLEQDRVNPFLVSLRQ